MTGHIGKAQRLWSGNIVRTAGRISQHRSRGSGCILAGNEGASRLVRRTADHSIGIELVQKHVQIEGVSKYGIRDTGCRKVLLAQRTVSYTHLRAHETVLDLVC